MWTIFDKGNPWDNWDTDYNSRKMRQKHWLGGGSKKIGVPYQWTLSATVEFEHRVAPDTWDPSSDVLQQKKQK